MAGDNGWKRAFSLVAKTTPFLGVNALVYGAFFFISLVWFGLWGGAGYLLAVNDLGLPALICLLIGFGAWGGVVKFARRYVLYMLKGAHIAAMTELHRDGRLPEDQNQFAYGREVIETHFKDVSLLFGLDTMVHAILKTIQRQIVRIGSWLPLPEGADQIVRMATQILNRSLTYIDEVILSYAIHRGEENVWESARHGILLYAQSYKPILITAAKIWAIGKVFAFITFVVFMAPAIALMLMVNTLVVQVLGVVLALVAAWTVKQAFFEPYALAYMLVSYHDAIEGVEPDPEWDEKLKGVSDEYRELVDKAKAGMTSGSESDASSTPEPETPAPSADA